jgi:signal transduction histidine kinase
MNRSLALRIAGPVILVGLILVAALLVVNAAIGQYRESARTAVRTERLIGQANATKNLLLDAETGVRGFSLTGEERFLQPWLAATRQFDPAAQALVDGAAGAARPIAERIQRDGDSYLRDYSQPLVASRRANPDAGVVQTTTEGKQRIDALRAEFSQFVRQLQADSSASTSRARSYGDRAKWITIASIAGIVVLLGALIVYLARFIARPIRQIATAADEVRAGRLDIRVPIVRRDEIGTLGASFNAMAASLEQTSAELESQNAELESQNQEMESQAVELEAQTAELENAQQELSERNEELVRQQVELETSAASLREAHARVRVYAEVSDRLGRRPDLDARAETALAAVSDLVDAQVGTLYAAINQDPGPLTLVATRGLDAGAVGQALPSGEDLPGRAVRERRTLSLTHPDTGLRLRAFGQDVMIRHELHVPLLHGESALGVLSVGRVGEQPFTRSEIEAAEHLAELTAVALDNAMITRRARDLADINRAVLDATRDGIRLVDLDGRTVLVNPAMEEMAREALADHDGFVATITDPQEESVDEFEVPETGRWFHRYSAPVRTAAGALVGRIFVLRETTEEHNAERLKDELMATVSHELRTPLAAILGFTELLLTRDFGAEERETHTRTVHQQAERLSNLIGDFLDLQRLDQHAMDLGRDEVDVSDLLREQVALYAAQSDAHQLSLRLPVEPLVTYGDAPSLARVLGNLLSNAIKYSPDGGVISVNAARDGDALAISVTDSGIGIPAEARERIFDRFYRVDSSETRTIGGTGLGLSLVREIVREHGGSVTVDSVDGHGSTFSVTLPAASAVPSPSAAD